MTSVEEQIGAVCDLVERKPKLHERYLLAIAGPPASGKSTLAHGVVQRLNQDNPERAALVPMDGYHLDNPILEERGLRAHKGAPETFNGSGYCGLIAQLASERTEVFAPRFDRDLDAAIANAIRIGPETDILVAEGNYLLLRDLPWSALRDYFSASVFLSPSKNTLHHRLEARWDNAGFDATRLQAQLQNDHANIVTVLTHSTDASLTLPG